MSGKLQTRRTSLDPNVQGSSAWLAKLSSELSSKDMSLVPNANVVALDPDLLKRDVERLTVRLRRMSKYLLNPHSKYMQYWDFVILFAMLFTATVSPYEVCLIWDSDFAIDGLFVVNLIINLIFLADTISQFFLPYKESPKKGGQMVKNHRRIAIHYIETWFVIDLVSVIPFDYITLGIEIDPSNVSLIQSISLLRLMRLIKLVRILRASRIFARWENSISLRSSTRELITLLSLIVFTLHLFSCVMGMAAQLMKANRNSDFVALVEARIEADITNCYGCIHGDDRYQMYCESGCYTPCELDVKVDQELPNAYDDERVRHRLLLQSQESWVCRQNTEGEIGQMPHKHGEVYMAGLYIALLQMSGGVGQIVPQNFTEYALFFLFIAIGSVMWALVVGTICGISAAGNPFQMEYKHNIDSLNYFLEDMALPTELRHKAREYLRNSKDLSKKIAYNDVVDRLSPEVKKNIVLTMSAKILQSVWFLEDVEPDALVQVSMMLRREGFAPRERLYADKLTILMRGVAAKGGIIMTHDASKTAVPKDLANAAVKGKRMSGAPILPHWGEDIILNSPALRDRKPAAALTYCEVLTLDKKDIENVCDRFPVSKKHIRRAAVYMAVRRSFATVADYVTDHFGDDFAMGASAMVKPVPAKPKPSASASPRMVSAEKVLQCINDTSSRIPIGKGMPTVGGEMGEVMRILQRQEEMLQTLAKAYGGVVEKVTESNMSA